MWNQRKWKFGKVLAIIATLTFVLIIRRSFDYGYVAHISPCQNQLKEHNVSQSFKKTNTYYLVILVTSAPTKLATRQIIRDTWLSEKHSNVLHYFAIGTKGITASVYDEIAMENATYGDILFLSEVKDFYETLTSKVLAGLQWINSNVNFNFVLKCDDDSFVRVSDLVAELLKQPQKLLYWGFFKGGSKVFSRGQWKEREWYLCDTYLPYAVGGGYVLSQDLVEYISRNADLLQQYSSEDVSVGTWLAPLKLNRVHDTRFDTEYKSRGCFNEYLVTHKQDASSLKELHKNLKNYGHLCENEMRLRYSYNYNWSVKPTDCCKQYDFSLP
nr:EOG090X0A8N [Cyclestheria hislopi]